MLVVGSIDMAQVTILYDNHAQERLLSGWGFSALIRTAESTVLFDCGADRLVLSHNAEALGVDPRGIQALALSHEHCDHTGGLSAVLHDGLSLCVPKAFARRFASMHRLGVIRRAVTLPLEIAPGIRSIGPARRNTTRASARRIPPPPPRD